MSFDSRESMSDFNASDFASFSGSEVDIKERQPSLALSDTDRNLLEIMPEEQFGEGVPATKSKPAYKFSLSTVNETNMVLAQLSAEERRLIEDAPSNPAEDVQLSKSENYGNSGRPGGIAYRREQAAASMGTGSPRRMSAGIKVDAALLGINSPGANEANAANDTHVPRTKSHAPLMQKAGGDTKKTKDAAEGKPGNGVPAAPKMKTTVSLTALAMNENGGKAEMPPDQRPVHDVDLSKSFAETRASEMWDAKTSGSSKKRGGSSWRTRLQAKVDNSPVKDREGTGFGSFSLNDVLVSKSEDGNINGGLAGVVGSGLRHRPRRSVSDDVTEGDEASEKAAATMDVAVNKLGGSILQRLRQLKVEEGTETADNGKTKQGDGSGRGGTRIDTIPEATEAGDLNNPARPKSALKKKPSLWGGLKKSLGKKKVSQVSIKAPDFEEEVCSDEVQYFPGAEHSSGGEVGGSDDDRAGDRTSENEDDDQLGWDLSSQKPPRYASTHSQSSDDDQDHESPALDKVLQARRTASLRQHRANSASAAVRGVGSKRSSGSCFGSCCRMIMFFIVLMLLAVGGLFVSFKMRSSS